MTQPPTKSGYVLPETTILALLGCLDLLSTVYLLATNRAHEANPLFASILDAFGPIGFIVFKALMLGGPLTLAEIARKHREPFVRSALRVGIVCYIALYLFSFVRNNPGLI